MDSRPGLVALAALDDIIAARPHADQQLFSKATHCLSAFRDSLIADYRPGHPSATQRARLEQVNAVISILMAGHFPLGETPWRELEESRAWLQSATVS